MGSLLARVRVFDQDELLRQKGLKVGHEQLMTVREINIAGAAQVTGSYVGRFLTLFLLMFLLSSSSIIAIDSIAGEKERGSIETLLTTAADRIEIVAAKQLCILTVALGITLIQVMNVLAYVYFQILPLPKDWVIKAPPATVITLLFLFIPLAAFSASILLIISAYAKTYKEAKLYFFPVYLVSLVPALAGVFPTIDLRSVIAVIPIANVSVAVREIMVGRFDWPMIGVVFCSMSLAAMWSVRASALILSKESLVTASDADAADFAGGPALFPKRVLRWYGVLAVVMFVVAFNVPQLGTFRTQILFNEVVLFLGASLLMVRAYKLNIREAWAMRPVKPLAWLGILLLIPSGIVVAHGVFRLADLIFPVPERMLEQFAKDIMPKDIPHWQLYLFMSLLPGVCEEIAFRGTLLYGLRRKLKPVALTLAVGIIFGLFHVALFRILPTAFLGIVLTSIALLTGSIFPGMVAHAANNAMGLLLSDYGVSLSKIGWSAYAGAAAVFALAFYILYRARTPYPGLRV